jgi:hypothetical protein
MDDVTVQARAKGAKVEDRAMVYATVTVKATGSQ